MNGLGKNNDMYAAPMRLLGGAEVVYDAATEVRHLRAVLKEIISEGSPYSRDKWDEVSCDYCGVGDHAGHRSDCAWIYAEGLVKDA